MELHERLAYILRIRQMTQRQLAEAVDYSEATISKWVQGRAQPPVAGLVSICEALNLSADWLLWGNQPVEDAPVSTTPLWEAVDTTFSMRSTKFDDLLAAAQTLFFTSAWLPRAFDAHNPTVSKLVEQGIKMRFVFPQLDLTLIPYDTDGPTTPLQYERKKLTLLSSLYQIQEWGEQCSVELRLIAARPVSNLLAVNYHSPNGRILYIPYLYGDFEYGPRPGFILDRQQHPEWYDQFYGRYVAKLWEDAAPVENISSLIEKLRTG
jgi:transcriptional regulator with XRE-family HTH domain